MSDLVLQLLDNVDLILGGEANEPNLPDDFVISYGLYSDLLHGLSEKKLNVQSTLPILLLHLSPSVKIPSKISNLTRKVNKFLEKNPDGRNLPVDGLITDDFDTGDTNTISDLGVNISEISSTMKTVKILSNYKSIIFCV